MAWRSGKMAAPRVAPAAQFGAQFASPFAAPLVALLGALLVTATARAPTQDPVLFEAAFQGRCGPGSPCEQLCRELHDGTYECGCGPGYVLHVDGYGCLELNSTKATVTSLDAEEDILYQKDVSFSAELEVAPSNRISKPTVSLKHIAEDKRLTTQPAEDNARHNYTYTGEKSKQFDGLKSLIEDGISKTDINIIADELKEHVSETSQKVTTTGPSLEQKVPGATLSPPWTAAVEACGCDSSCGTERCSCHHPLSKCKTDTNISTPRFSGSSWIAFHALRGAYKRVRLRMRVRPERARGVLLLTGEHDDLSGDYLALMLRNGHVELRFDCGSGAGILRSPEPIRLGRWNTISVYRHRWDAWLRLNNGKRVRGRSKGLFSRMTFREPVWLGGTGNTTGLQSKLGLSEGLLGCVDFLRINGDTYRLVKDAVATLEIGECAPTLAPWKPPSEVTTIETSQPHPEVESHSIYDINDIVHFEDNDLVMRDAKNYQDNNKLENSIDPLSNYNVPKLQDNALNNVIGDDESEAKDGKVREDKSTCECQHGGGCVNKVCLCPLGYAGDKCEITLDLKVPRFNGSSYLRLPGLGNSAQSWLDIQITLKPTNGDGLLLYSSEHANGEGDFFSLHLRDYFVEFAFDLGSGITVVRSSHQLHPNTWHSVSVSRWGRRATLRVRNADYKDNNHAGNIGSNNHAVNIPSNNHANKGSGNHANRASNNHAGYTSENNHAGILSSDHAGNTPSSSRSGSSRSGSSSNPWWWSRVVARGSARTLSLHQPLLLGGTPEPMPSRLAIEKSFSGCVGQLVINDEELSVVSSALGGLNVDNCDETSNDTCTGTFCKELLQPYPQYPQNLTERESHHSIVPKKGLKNIHHKVKPKKHPHSHIDKKKYVKKHQHYNEVGDIRGTDDYGTYIQVKYINANEINWGDTNTYPSFSGTDSFIHIDDDETVKRVVSYSLDINIRFRSETSHGLLVWSGRSATTAPNDFLSLAVENGVLVFRYDLGSGPVVIIANHTRVDDGLWHRARATRNRQAGVLEVDGLGSVGKISPGKHKQLNTENGLYIGGLPSIELNTMGKYKSGLVGCVSQISLSGDFDIPLSLSKLPHTITNNVGRCTP